MNLTPVSKQALSLGTINGFVVVMLGAFGAHGLEAKISADMLDVFNTGVQYHMFHVVGFVAVALIGMVKQKSRRLTFSLWFFLGGTILFSGSLYLLSITGLSQLGMVTPMGGVAFLIAWMLLFIEVIAVSD